jgi:hypothetical protein
MKVHLSLVIDECLARHRLSGVRHGPRECVVSDLLPTRGTGEVRATGKFHVLGDRARVVGRLPVVANEVGWHDVVFAQRDEQERRAWFALDARRRGCVTPKVRERVIA